MRRYRVRRAVDVSNDLDLIDGYLANAYQDLGEDRAAAMKRAAARVDEALAYLRSLTQHPHRGTEHPEIRPGVRTVTSKRFVFYFEIDDLAFEVRILAVFCGGVDHRRQIADRLRHETRADHPGTLALDDGQSMTPVIV